MPGQGTTPTPISPLSKNFTGLRPSASRSVLGEMLMAYLESSVHMVAMLCLESKYVPFTVMKISRRITRI